MIWTELEALPKMKKSKRKMCLGFFKKLFYVSKVSKANVKKKIPLAFQKEISKEEKVQISNTVLLNKIS